MALIRIPYWPHEKQAPFHNSKAKFRAIISGVAFGKTCAGANELLRMAVQHPRSMFLIMAPNGKIMTHATLPELYKFGRKLIIGEKKSKNIIHLLGGGTIIYLTADNTRHIDRLRGMTIGGFWADEGSLFLRQVWDVLLARLRCQHGPLKGIVTTTPKGLNWLYWYFVKKSNPVSKRVLKNAAQYEFFGGTTLDNPYTPQEFKDTLMQQYSGVFKRQEIYGEFVGFEGQVYPNFKHAVHVISEVPGKLKEYIYGLDWGYTNPMAAVIVGLDGDGRAYVLEEFYESGVQIETVISWLQEMRKKYHFEQGYADPSEPQFIARLNDHELGCVEADNQILPGINKVYDFVEVRNDGRPRLYILGHCVNTIDEFTNYRYAETREGTPKVEKPLKLDDHLMDALRYALKTHVFGGQSADWLSDPDGLVF